MASMLKGKVAAMVGNIAQSFEHDSKAQTQLREKQARWDTAGLLDNVARLEKTMNDEMKRRTEANKTLQGMFEAQMLTVQDKLEASLLERIDGLTNSVGSLNDRIDAVERDFSQAREQYIRDIEDRSAMVAKDASSLYVSFQAEKNDRKEREEMIIAKLRDMEGRTAERLQNEQKLCEQQFSALREQLSAVVQDNGDNKFHNYILEEMAALKNGVVMETQVREHSDDEIVNALNHYTKSIQDALRIVSQAG